MKSSSRFLILLLVLTLGLAGLLAVEAWRATRSHRVTAERALRDYATVAAWELLSATDEELQRRAGAALGAVAGSPAASPYDSLPSAAALSPAADSLLPCASAATPSASAFALDLRTGNLATAGATPSPTLRAWLADTLATAARIQPAGATRYGTVWGPRGGPAAGTLAVFAVKSVRYNGFAVHDAPLAVYGVVTCPESFAALLDGVLRAPPAASGAGRGGRAERNARRRHGDRRRRLRAVHRRTRHARRRPMRATPRRATGRSTVRAWLPADVAGRLVVARPGAGLPLLLGLLVLTAGLTATAAFQFRREQELVRLRQDFTSSVSHELRTPLTQILLFGETLELGRAGGEDAQREAIASHRAGGAPAGAPGGERAAPLPRRAAAGARLPGADARGGRAPRDRRTLRAAGGRRLPSGSAPSSTRRWSRWRTRRPCIRS